MGYVHVFHLLGPFLTYVQSIHIVINYIIVFFIFISVIKLY